MALLELKDVSKKYVMGGEVVVPALKNVSLSIEASEFVAIMGPSGSGKSTLLAILGLLDKADQGEIKLLGRDISRMSDNEYARLRSQFFGFIFQTFNLLPRLNVVANVQLPFVYSYRPLPDDSRRVVDLLRQIGLGDRLRHRPNQLSGGQQQRVAVARALANRPLVILADEPTGNLDSKSSSEIIELLRTLNAQGNTIVMVTHEAAFSEAANRIIKLRDGEIVADEKKSERSVSTRKEANFVLHPRTGLLSWRRLKNYFYEAFVSMANNKLRSFLSILGVLIGVAAVIAMLAMGTGAQKQVEQTMASLGTNLLSVSTSFRARGIALGADSITRFTPEDLEAIKRIDAVERVVPNVSGRVQAVYQNRNWNTSVAGSTPDFQQVRNAAPETGRFFTEPEVAGRAKVAVLGKTVVKELFGDTSPIGKQIRLNRIAFNVIGVLPEKGATGFQNFDDRILIPFTTAMYRLLGRDYINSFDVQVSDAKNMPAVQEEISTTLMRLHRLAESQTENIEVRNMAEMQQAAGEMVQTFGLLLGSIATVSLLVGGIGIMNIMLVMVMERTHEIGLRKALGAENRDIMMQFMVEAVLICILGGLIGIGLGSFISWAIAFFAGWAILVSAWSIGLAFTFSALTGLLFGLWPAWRAAKLLPIEALRYE